MQFAQKNSAVNLRTLTKVSVLGAIAAILTLFELPLWFAPSFYKLDLSEVVVLISGFAMGPMAAVATEGVKILLNLLLNGTVTAGVGELANFLLGCAYVLPAVYVYQRRKTLAAGLWGMALGTLCLAVAGAFLNYYLLLPTYALAFRMPIESLVAMATEINPAITDLWGFILLAVVPFNLLKGVVSAAICVPLYKRISPILHR